MAQTPSDLNGSPVEDTQPNDPHQDKTQVTTPRWEPGEAPTIGFEVPPRLSSLNQGNRVKPNHPAEFTTLAR